MRDLIDVSFVENCRILMRRNAELRSLLPPDRWLGSSLMSVSLASELLPYTIPAMLRGGWAMAQGLKGSRQTEPGTSTTGSWSSSVSPGLTAPRGRSVRRPGVREGGRLPAQRHHNSA